MINNKIDGFVHLLHGQNIIIIKELFNVSFFTNDMNINAQFIIEIIDQIDDHFGIAVFEENPSILNFFITYIRRRDSDTFSARFMKLTDLGAIVDDSYNFVLNDVPSDSFFFIM